MTDYSPRRLTDGIVKKLPLPATGKVRVFDAPDPDRPKLEWCQRFGVRLYAGGVRSFIVEYRPKGQPPRFHTIGTFPVWSVEAARSEAIEIRRRAEQDGVDPQAEKQAQRDAPTVAKLCDRFIAEHASTKRAKTKKGYEQTVETEIKPALGKKLVTAVTKEDCQKLFKEITKRAPYQANRVLACMSKMFTLAMGWRMRTDNPCKGIERNSEEKRERYLTNAELQRLTRALAQHEDQQVANAIRLLLLIGCRKGELLSAKWEAFDLVERGTWTKLGSQTKQKRQHTIPLNDTALSVLRAMEKAAPDDAEYLFPGDADGHLGDIKKQWAAVRRRAGITDAGRTRLRIHDLRHSFASFALNSGVTLETVGGLLGHSQIATTQRYSHLTDQTKREATAKVGSLLSGLAVTKPKRRKLRAVR
jgi:integrase